MWGDNMRNIHLCMVYLASTAPSNPRKPRQDFSPVPRDLDSRRFLSGQTVKRENKNHWCCINQSATGVTVQLGISSFRWGRSWHHLKQIRAKIGIEIKYLDEHKFECGSVSRSNGHDSPLLWTPVPSDAALHPAPSSDEWNVWRNQRVPVPGAWDLWRKSSKWGQKLARIRAQQSTVSRNWPGDGGGKSGRPPISCFIIVFRITMAMLGEKSRRHLLPGGDGSRPIPHVGESTSTNPMTIRGPSGRF